MHWQYVICPTCFGLRSLHSEWQRCRCQPRSPDEPIERRVSALCNCCGAEVIESGFRWASLHCRPCLERVRELNRAVGRCVIAVGVHSIMNGVGLQADETDPAVVDRFPRQLGNVFAAIGQVYEWGREVVKNNLEELGFPAGQDAMLSKYLRAARSIDKQEAFERLCEHFASRN